MRLEPARRPASPQPSDWIPDHGVGQRVEILWDSPHAWYSGTVANEAAELSGEGLTHRFIRYDDGTTAWERLGGRRTRPATSGTSSGGTAAAVAPGYAAKVPLPNAPASKPSASAVENSRPIFLPLGATQAQCAKLRENLNGEREGPAGGVMGRFGLAGLPENTWHLYGSDFTVRD